MQDPGSGVDLVPSPVPLPGGAPGTSVEPNVPDWRSVRLAPVRAAGQPAAGRGALSGSLGLPRLPAVPNPPPVGTGELPGTDPSIPGMNMTDVSPDRNDPFPNRSFADIVTSIEEAPTGRFMIGVGANSFQGLLGNLQIYEKNFDITRFPRSFSDIVNGQAFRGGGQSLMINLQAGNLMNYMSVSLREPYLFDLPIGASASGYLSSRIYPNWDERRGGGSFSLGRQFGTMIYSDVSMRAEEVDFFGYRIAGSCELPGRERLHVAVLAQAELADRQSEVREPEQPVHGHQGSVHSALDRARLGQFHLDQVRRGGSCLSSDRKPPGRHGQTVLHLPRALRDRNRDDSHLRALLCR